MQLKGIFKSLMKFANAIKWVQYLSTLAYVLTCFI